MSLLLDHPDLLAGYIRGDRSALEAIYFEYVDEVTRLVRRGFVYDRSKVVRVSGIGEESTQCDLVQETFVRAFSETARKGYDGRSPFRPYLLRIAKNLMIDRLRKLGREVPESELNLSGNAGEIPAFLGKDTPLLPENPAEQAHFKRQQATTEAFVATLPEPKRAFFDLRYRQGLSQQQVAKHLGATRRKVRTLEKQLRRELKKSLKFKRLWP
jgi:RNA polymerase sigma factor (sigma-70 family)